jgi:hypothetical protein
MSEIQNLATIVAADIAGSRKPGVADDIGQP